MTGLRECLSEAMSDFYYDRLARYSIKSIGKGRPEKTVDWCCGASHALFFCGSHATTTFSIRKRSRLPHHKTGGGRPSNPLRTIPATPVISPRDGTGRENSNNFVVFLDGVDNNRTVAVHHEDGRCIAQVLPCVVVGDSEATEEESRAEFGHGIRRLGVRWILHNPLGRIPFQRRIIGRFDEEACPVPGPLV